MVIAILVIMLIIAGVLVGILAEKGNTRDNASNTSNPPNQSGTIPLNSNPTTVVPSTPTSLINSEAMFTSNVNPPMGWHVTSSGTVHYDGNTSNGVPYGQPWIAPFDSTQYPNGITFQVTMTPQTSCGGTRLGAMGVQDQQNVRLEIILDCGSGDGIFVCKFSGDDSSQINFPNNFTQINLQQLPYTVEMTVAANGDFSTYLVNNTGKKLLVAGQIGSPVALVLDGYQEMGYTSLLIN